jgi:hypothetical protein
VSGCTWLTIPRLPTDEWPIMLSTPRNSTITLGSVSEPTRPPSKRPNLPLLLCLGVAALVAIGVGLGFAFSGDDPPTQDVQLPSPPPSSPSAPQFRPAVIGQPFDLGIWRIAVTSIRCGTAADLLAQNADNGQAPTDRVCVAAISYTNTDKSPHQFGGTIDETPPEDEFAGYAAGSRYDGTRWLSESVNPGLSQTNELIFKVPAGVSLDAVEIGDVRVVP